MLKTKAYIKFEVLNKSNIIQVNNDTSVAE